MEEQESILNRSRRSYVYESGRSNGNRKKIVLIVAGIVILALLVVVAALATGGKGEEENLTPTPTPTQEPTPTEEITPIEEITPTTEESPTPSKSLTVTPTKSSSSSSTKDSATGLDRANLTIEVQNGGGVPGAASKAKTTLEDLGYKVSGTSNADNFDYENTVIQVKSTKKAYLDLLKKDLSKSYTIGEATADLTSGTADAVIIVGKN